LKHFFKICFLIGAFLFIGCSLNPLGSFHKTTITSNPPGAKVFINNKYKGKTPLVFREKEGRTYEVMLEKEGYDPIIKNLTQELQQETKLKNWGLLWKVPLVKLPPSLPDEINFDLKPEGPYPFED
jgi:hypothetical protein